MSAEIVAELKKQNEALSKAIESQFQLVNKKIDDIKSLDTEVKKVTALHSAHNVRLENLEDRAVRHDRRRELLVRGVPFVSTEILKDVISKLSNAIGFSSLHSPNECTGFRLHRHDRDISTLTSKFRSLRSHISHPQSAQPPPILLKFMAEYDRENFLQLYFEKKSLAASDIGLSSNSRIYVSENFTQLNHKILMAANQMKKSGSIVSVFTKDGLVYVRGPSDSKRTLVHSLSHLNRITKMDAPH